MRPVNNDCTSTPQYCTGQTQANNNNDNNNNETKTQSICEQNRNLFYYRQPCVVTHGYNSSTQDAEAGGLLSVQNSYATECVPDQPRLSHETFSVKPQTGPQPKAPFFSTQMLPLCKLVPWWAAGQLLPL